MIIVKIMAGLGNQMFQYATGKALATSKKTELYVDISSYDNMADVDTPRRYELDIYSIQTKVVPNEILKTVLPPETIRPRYTERLKELLGTHRIWTYLEKHHGYNPEIWQTPKNVYLSGWWQSPKYFDSIRSDLLKEFEPKIPPGDKNIKYIEKARNLPSVSIHVRRGDYVSNQSAASYHGLTSIEYYSKAIDYFNKRLENPIFFVFSDDIEWCKNNLPLSNENSVFVEGNSGDQSFQDIRIMKNCKHAVIANSSFSWWGAWLNENPDKIVIAPQAWINDKASNDIMDNIPKDWIRF